MLNQYDPKCELKERDTPANPAVTFRALEAAANKVTSVSKARLAQARAMVGSLLYEATKISFDICPAVCRLASVALKPSDLFFNQAKWLFGYLRKRARGKPCLRYTRRQPTDAVTPSLLGLCDASYNTTSKCKSMCGWLLWHGHNLINYHTGLTRIICLSTAESETYGMSDLTKEILHLQMLQGSIGIQNMPATLGIDNMGALKNALGGSCGRTRHIEYRVMHTREAQDAGLIRLTHVGTTINLADIMSKCMGTTKQFTFLRDHIMHFQSYTAMDTDPSQRNKLSQHSR